MASEFTEVCLQDLAAPIPNATAAGPFGSNLVSRDYVPTGVPVIRGQNLIARWVSGEFVYVSQEKAQALRTNTARPGDVVFTQRGTLGQVALVPPIPFDRYVISQSQMKLSVDPTKADARFVYYACRTEQFIKSVHDNAVAAGVPHINLGTLRRLEIPCPSHAAQVEIANVLSALDDRIDHNRALAANLEAIARALFKSWFVDFDPVRAKAAGEAPPGLAPDLAVLFPDRFVDSELGEIPEGWRYTCVGQLAELVKGCSYKGAGLSEIDGAFMFNLGCFSEKRVFATEKIKRYLGDYREKHAVTAGDLILANTDMTQHREILGRPLLVPAGFEPGFISHHVFKVAMREGFNHQRWRNFLFFALQQDQFRERAVGHATGTTVLALARDSAEKCPVIEPAPPLLAAFTAIVDPMIEMIANSIASTETLTGLRDLMLPRLISGKLRVEDAEAA